MTERPEEPLPEWIGQATSHETARLVSEILSTAISGKFNGFELYPSARRVLFRRGGRESEGELILSRDNYDSAVARLETMAGIVHTKDEEQIGVTSLDVKRKHYKIKITTMKVLNGKYLSAEVTSD